MSVENNKTKICNDCKDNLPSSHFRIRKLKYNVGLSPYCIKCLKLRNIKYKKYNSDVYKKWYKSNPDRNKNYKLVANYGITLDQYNELLKQQNFKCKICDNSKSNSKLSTKLFVDHCHISGKIRGLLCDSCNKGLGLFKDNKELLKKSIKYLEDSYDRLE